MADNFQITQGSGTTIAAHDNGTALEQQVQITNFPATQPVSGIVTANAGTGNFTVAQATGSNLHVVVDTAPTTTVTGTVTTNEDWSTGRTPILKTGTLVTAATTADQVILTYTVTAGKTFFLLYLTYDVRLTVVSATASILGTISLETPAGTKGFTSTEVNPTTSETASTVLSIPNPIPIPAGTVIRFVCTPAATTSMTWVANFGGYEK